MSLQQKVGLGYDERLLAILFPFYLHFLTHFLLITKIRRGIPSTMKHGESCMHFFKVIFVTNHFFMYVQRLEVIFAPCGLK